ncbi:MAG TPA: allophanate hydrolase [Cryptosporangiaceae bacterium]|nr:allophanate hydrolase [Cryptosporangiaceae bacterium]
MGRADQADRPGSDLGTLQIEPLLARYRVGLVPAEVVSVVYDRIAAGGDDNVWILLRERDEVSAEASELARRWPDPHDRPPLFGIPFAVKDNVDVAGLPTTAGCPDYSYRAERSAPLVERLREAGAILVGKTNLDQFATGLTGTRSPYGPCASPMSPGLISGGSSSGSAVAVSAGLVSFAIGTDTAGSGRVPASMCNVVGLKPSRGLVSTLGVVPACPSLDCASVFALSVPDALTVLTCIAGAEPDDPWSVPGLPLPPALPPPVPAGTRVGVPLPAQRDFGGDVEAARVYEGGLARLAEMGATVVPVDLEPFLAAGRLLYDGPWVAERSSHLGEFLAAHLDGVHPVTAQVLTGGAAFSAADAFRGLHRLAALRAEVAGVWHHLDALMVPTVPTAFTIEEVLADPIGSNAFLGHYTHFCNLLDLAAVAVPNGCTPAGVPFGVSFLAPAGRDGRLAGLAAEFQRRADLALGATPHRLAAAAGDGAVGVEAAADPADVHVEPDVRETVLLAVVGAHRTAQALHPELSALGATLVGTAWTAPRYRLFALGEDGIRRAGLVRVSDGGARVEVELHRVPVEGLAALLRQLPAPLGAGHLDLDDGSTTLGLLCEAYATAEARDITGYGSWPEYLRVTGHVHRADHGRGDGNAQLAAS